MQRFQIIRKLFSSKVSIFVIFRSVSMAEETFEKATNSTQINPTTLCGSSSITWTINTNFADLKPNSTPNSTQQNSNGGSGYDFQKYQRIPNGFSRQKSENLNSIPSGWTMDCEDGLIVLGCSNGRIEIWETMTCQFKVCLNSTFCYCFFSREIDELHNSFYFSRSVPMMTPRKLESLI